MLSGFALKKLFYVVDDGSYPPEEGRLCYSTLDFSLTEDSEVDLDALEDDEYYEVAEYKLVSVKKYRLETKPVLVK